MGWPGLMGLIKADGGGVLVVDISVGAVEGRSGCRIGRMEICDSASIQG